MKRPIKSFRYSDKKSLVIDDKVYLDGDIVEYKGKTCPFCNDETNGITTVLLTYHEDLVCEAHKIWMLTDIIGSKKSLRIEQWRQDKSAWRAGIEWYGEDEYEFICEYPSLLECLLKINEYLDNKNERK